MTEPVPDRAPDGEPADDRDEAAPDGAAPATNPVWWTAVPVLVGAYAVYGLAQGDNGAIWPWGDVVMLVVALALLAVVLAPRLRGRR